MGSLRLAISEKRPVIHSTAINNITRVNAKYYGTARATRLAFIAHGAIVPIEGFDCLDLREDQSIESDVKHEGGC